MGPKKKCTNIGLWSMNEDWKSALTLDLEYEWGLEKYTYVGL